MARRFRRNNWNSANSTRKKALAAGYRSNFEMEIGQSLKENKQSFEYETEKIKYVIPAAKRTYSPDFILEKKDGSKMYIEAKGRWTGEDRKKIKLVKEQHPDMDLRIVFQTPGAKIRKNSKTTYSDFAEKLGIPWAKKHIPTKWFEECA